MITEQWRDVVNYEGLYSVSDLGRIRRDGTMAGAVVGRILKTGISGAGYRQVTLCNNGVKKTTRVHKIVTEAFIGKRPEHFQINHKDGVKTNNSILNLEYITPKMNTKHAFATGLSKPLKGEENGNSKLTYENVREILNLHKTGNISCGKISKIFHVSVTLICKIVNRDMWAHVTL